MCPSLHQSPSNFLSNVKRTLPDLHQKIWNLWNRKAHFSTPSDATAVQMHLKKCFLCLWSACSHTFPCQEISYKSQTENFFLLLSSSCESQLESATVVVVENHVESSKKLVMPASAKGISVLLYSPLRFKKKKKEPRSSCSRDILNCKYKSGSESCNQQPVCV